MIDLITGPNLRTLIQVDTLLVLGLMLASNYTSVLRLSRKVYATPEDYALNRMALPAAAESTSTQRVDDPIARSRRIHANHLENVLPFILLSWLYALSAPSHWLFAGLLWSYLATRVVYTVFYARGMQPQRTIAFIGGFVIKATMAITTLFAAFGP